MAESTQLGLHALSSARPPTASEQDEILALARQLIIEHGTAVVPMLDRRAATMRKEGQPHDARFWQSVADRAAGILENHWTRH